MKFPKFIAPPDAAYARQALRKADKLLDDYIYLCVALRHLPYPFEDLNDHLVEFQKRSDLIKWIEQMLHPCYSVTSWRNAHLPELAGTDARQYRRDWIAYLHANLRNLP